LIDDDWPATANKNAHEQMTTSILFIIHPLAISSHGDIVKLSAVPIKPTINYLQLRSPKKLQKKWSNRA
jgi:hypothetical protein